MNKEQIEKELYDLNQRFFTELSMRNWGEVELIEKKMKRLEALQRILSDEEDVKPNPAIPDSVMLNFMKRLKQN